MHHIIPPPGCKQAPPVLNGALSSHGGSFIAPLRLCAPTAKLEFSKFSHQEIYNSLSSPLYARGKENRPPGPVFFPPQIMSQYRKNRRRRLTGESCSVNNIGVYILFIIYEQGRVADETTNDFRCFVYPCAVDCRYAPVAADEAGLRFPQLFGALFGLLGDPGMFFILCIPSAILLVAAKYFLL